MKQMLLKLQNSKTEMKTTFYTSSPLKCNLMNITNERHGIFTKPCSHGKKLDQTHFWACKKTNTMSEILTLQFTKQARPKSK